MSTHYDDYDLSSEISRTAAVAARHLSRAEAGDPNPIVEDAWRRSAARHETRFLTLVEIARARLLDPITFPETRRYLAFFGSDALVEPQLQTTTSR